MSNLSYSEYLERFSVVSRVGIREGVDAGLYQDKSDKTIYNVVIYTSIDKKTRDIIMAEFFQAYSPNYSLKLVYFTGKKPQSGRDSEDEERNLILIFEPSKTLAEFLLYSPDTDFCAPEGANPTNLDLQPSNERLQVQTLTIKEVSNIFACIVDYLDSIHASNLAHGDIREGTVHVVNTLVHEGADPKSTKTRESITSVKGHMFPGMPTFEEGISKHQKGLFTLPEDVEYKVSGTTRTEAAARLGVPPSQAQVFEQYIRQQGDIYSLAAMIIRLMNPALFFSAIMPDPYLGKLHGWIDGARLLKVTESMQSLFGYPLGPVLLECLSISPQERPTSAEIKEKLKHLRKEDPGPLEESALSLRRWEHQDHEESESGSPNTKHPAQERVGEEHEKEKSPRLAQSMKESLKQRSAYGSHNFASMHPGQSIMNHLKTSFGKQPFVDSLKIPKRSFLAGMQGDIETDGLEQKSPRFTSNSPSLGLSSPLRQPKPSDQDYLRNFRSSINQLYDPLGNHRETYSEQGLQVPNPTPSWPSNPLPFFKSALSGQARPTSPRFRPAPSSPHVSNQPTSPASRVLPLKLQCLASLENLFSSVHSSPPTSHTFGDTHYYLRLLEPLSSGYSPVVVGPRPLGFIQYPSDDLYFGWVQQLAKDDTGLLLLASGDVYHGHFRRGRLSGRGTYLFLTGECYQGNWKDDELDGEGTFWDSQGNAMACRFQAGILLDKAPLELEKPGAQFRESELEEFYRKGFMNTEVVQQLIRDYINKPSSQLQHERSRTERSTSTPKEPIQHQFEIMRPTIKKPKFTDILSPTKQDLQALAESSTNAQHFYKSYYRDLLAQQQQEKSPQVPERKLAHYLHEEYLNEEQAGQNVVLEQLQKIYGKLERLDLKATKRPNLYAEPDQKRNAGRYWERMGDSLKQDGHPQEIRLSPYKHKVDPEYAEQRKKPSSNFKISELEEEESSFSRIQQMPDRRRSTTPRTKSGQHPASNIPDRYSEVGSRFAEQQSPDSFDRLSKPNQPTPRTARRRDEAAAENPNPNQEFRIVMTVKPELVSDIRRSPSKNPKKQEQGRLANILDDLDSELEEQQGRGSQLPTSQAKRSRSPIARTSSALADTQQPNIDTLKRKAITVNGETDAVGRENFEIGRGFGSFNSANHPVFNYDPRHNGFAQVFFQHGERFYGNFVNGLAEGRGAYYSRDGWIIQGLWKKGKLDQLLDSPFSKQSNR